MDAANLTALNKSKSRGEGAFGQVVRLLRGK